MQENKMGVMPVGKLLITMSLPMMASIQFRLMRNVFDMYGYKTVLLETSGPEIAQVGLKYVHNDTCYPEGHVECARKEDDIDHLKQKVDSGCDFMTTQMFFNNDILYHFLYQTLSKGIHIPVVAGIMPVTNASQITRITKISGTYLPPRFKSMVEKFEHSPEAMMQAGIAYATEQIIDLICNGVNHIHLYTMNKPEIAGQIMANLSHVAEV